MKDVLGYTVKNFANYHSSREIWISRFKGYIGESIPFEQFIGDWKSKAFDNYTTECGSDPVGGSIVSYPDKENRFGRELTNGGDYGKLHSDGYHSCIHNTAHRSHCSVSGNGSQIYSIGDDNHLMILHGCVNTDDVQPETNGIYYHKAPGILSFGGDNIISSYAHNSFIVSCGGGNLLQIFGRNSIVFIEGCRTRVLSVPGTIIVVNGEYTITQEPPNGEGLVHRNIE